MSIVQISRIQHRSGLYENLPQLAKAELGYVVDQRRLFIGNGLLTDGAPQTGNTEILTEYSDILNLASLYNYKNSDAGYNPQTGNTRSNFNGIASNGSLYVAVGSSGTILTSSDGIVWSSTISGTSQNLLSVIYGGGLFVATGTNGTVIYSTNGTVWQASGAVSYTNINSVIYAGGQYVLVTSLGEVYTSNNAIAWTKQASTISVSLNAIAYGSSKYVAGGKNGTVITSSDGVTWSSGTVSFDDILGLAYLTDTSGSYFVATCAKNKIYYSADGVTWYRSLVDAFVSVTNDGTNSWAITSWGDVYQGSTGTFTYQTNIAAAENFTYIYQNGAGLFTALTGSGGIYTSGNGLTWTSRTSGVTTGLNAVYFDGTTWVIVGDSGVILSSTNGTSFTSRTSGTTANLVGISKLSTTLWIAVGDSGTILTSPNLVTWTARSSGTTSNLRNVAVANLGGGTYKIIAVGTGGIGVSSSDGLAWTSAISNSATDPFGNTVALSDLNNIGYFSFTPPGGSLTNLWIIVGDHGVLATSTNGTSWNTKTTNTTANFTNITYTNSYFYVSGDAGLSYLSGQTGLAYTYYNLYYSNSSLQPDLYSITTNGTLNVIGGAYGYLFYSTNQFKFYKKENASLSYTNRSVGYFNSTFFAVGYNGHISTSSTGQAWTSQNFSYGGTITQRSIQKKLDDIVSVKDFGAKGDGLTDDTEAINRAMYELYCRVRNQSSYKILHFPAGTYIINGSLNVPSNARLFGEGAGNTIITQTANPYIYPYVTWVMYTADNLQQIQNQIGLNGASLPNNITIRDMTLNSLNDGLIIDSASSVQLQSVSFNGPFNAVSTATDSNNGSITAGVKFYGKSLVFATDINIVDCYFNGFNCGIYLPSLNYTSNCLFDSCTFNNMYYGVYLNGASAKGITLSNSFMNLIYSYGLYAANCKNILSLSNYYQDVGDKLLGVSYPNVPVIYWDTTAQSSGSIGDTFDRTDAYTVSETVNTFQWDFSEGLRLGTYQTNSGESLALANNTTAPLITNLDDYGTTFGLEFQYSITRNSQVASGVAKFTLTSSGLYSIEDDRSQSGDVGVTFGYNGSTDLTYTTDSNGTGLINYAIRYFEML
jgi:Pectate lyase superfamily protein